MTEVATLGAELRSLRRAKGMRLVDLAAALGRSVGWLSQVERNLSTPSAMDLQDIARVLDVPLSSLFRSSAPPQEQGLIVRKGAHRVIAPRMPGLTELLLSPDMTDSFEVLRTTIAPGARRAAAEVRATQEVGHVISGRFDLWISGVRFEIRTGDSFRVRGEPFSWMNPYHLPCELIWVVSPPVL